MGKTHARETWLLYVLALGVLAGRIVYLFDNGLDQQHTSIVVSSISTHSCVPTILAMQVF